MEGGVSHLVILYSGCELVSNCGSPLEEDGKEEEENGEQDEEDGEEEDRVPNYSNGCVVKHARESARECECAHAMRTVSNNTFIEQKHSWRHPYASETRE